MKNNKILMIINEFPPTGESGVQRPLKFLKYLDRMNWETHVITPEKPTKTVLDYSLLKEIPSRCRIHKTMSLGIRGRSVDRISEIRFKFTSNRKIVSKVLWRIFKTINDVVFPIDKQIGWVPFAIFSAIKVISRYQTRNIYITAYPFSAFLIGLFLKSIYRNRIYWIADYRDAWQFEPKQGQGLSPLRFSIISHLDDLVLLKCDRVVFVTSFIRNKYIRKFPWLESKAEVITNGFDEDDFQNLQPVKFDKFTFMYMGKIYSYKGSPISVLNSLRLFQLDLFQYIHIGTISNEILSEIHTHNYPFFKFEGYKSHNEAINHSAGADINVVIINDDPESEGVLTGKIFELIRIGKPILAVGPPTGVVKDLVEQSKVGLYACIGDEIDIANKANLLVDWITNAHDESQNISSFSRESLTSRLASLFVNQS